MRVVGALKAAGDTHPGLKREVNEDRFHFDPARGIFIVVDGVGGHAAGEKAAETALSMLRLRLERETGPIADRVREAIAIANNEIHRLASLRTEWTGMACVLTVAIVDNGHAVVGHVGDTRLYKLFRDRIEKITHDHSPIGEREDAQEISELEAMRHPRRNEVYRDVGSEPHDAADPDFVDLVQIPFEPDSALMLCTDGLTDLVSSETISEIVGHFAGRPYEVVRALIDAANDAGGKDNVTVVYVEGEQFGAMRNGAAAVPARVAEPAASRAPVRADERATTVRAVSKRPAERRKRVLIGLVVLLTLVVAAAAYRAPIQWPSWSLARSADSGVHVLAVQATESIAAVLERAERGSVVIVEPGEYRERLVLKNGVRVISRIPRAATIRLPGVASEGDVAVMADGVSGAELVGFKIVGDAATALGTGLVIANSDLNVIDVEIVFAANAAIDFREGARGSLIGSDIHGNLGSALKIHSGASPRIAHNVFTKNGLSEHATAFVIERGAQPRWSGNVFRGLKPDALTGIDEAARATLTLENWFPELDPPPSSTPGTPPHRRGR